MVTSRWDIVTRSDILRKWTHLNASNTRRRGILVSVFKPSNFIWWFQLQTDGYSSGLNWNRQMNMNTQGNGQLSTALILELQTTAVIVCTVFQMKSKFGEKCGETVQLGIHEKLVKFFPNNRCMFRSFVCLLLNGTSALFRIFVPSTIQIEHMRHVKIDL